MSNTRKAGLSLKVAGTFLEVEADICNTKLTKVHTWQSMKIFQESLGKIFKIYIAFGTLC